jgi:hypothetical protein
MGERDRYDIYHAIWDTGRGDAIPSGLGDLKALVAKIEREVPAEYHDVVAVRLCPWGGDDPDIEMLVEYYRPETDDEYAKRLEGIERRNAANRRRSAEARKRKAIKERELYEALKAKYEAAQ